MHTIDYTIDFKSVHAKQVVLLKRACLSDLTISSLAGLSSQTKGEHGHPKT